MNFSIYVEYPEQELDNLANLTTLHNLIIAAHNMDEFEVWRAQLESTSQVQRIGYWPLLTQKEGYWLSPFADPEAVLRIIQELRETSESRKDNLLVNWDAELPFGEERRKRFLTPKKTKIETSRRIFQFLASANNYRIDIATSEYPSIMFGERFQRKNGISFHPQYLNLHHKTKMAYTSLIQKYAFGSRKLAKKILARECRRGQELCKDRFAVALGCLATGEFRDEPILTEQELIEDLQIVQQAGIENVYLFRLGGITPNIASILKDFTQNQVSSLGSSSQQTYDTSPNSS